MRYKELDALRGLAAVTVLLSHTDLIYPWRLGYLEATPLHLFWAGHSAVVLFFVLSGFVLSQPWIHGKEVSAREFAVRRTCRIWLPFLVALAVSIALRVAVHPTELIGSSDFPYLSHGYLGDAQAFYAASLIGYFDAVPINAAFWSLAHEMRVSLVFPLIICGVIGKGWRRVSAGVFVVSLLAGIFRKYTHPEFGTDAFNTIYYGCFFVVGYLAASNLKALCGRISTGVLLLLAALFYSYGFWFFPEVPALHLPKIEDWFIAVGSVGFIVAALQGGIFGQILRSRVPQWLGGISYSLYLLHVPVLVACVFLFPAARITGILLGMGGSLVLAALFSRCVEQPSITLGRWLTSAAVISTVEAPAQP